MRVVLQRGSLAGRKACPQACRPSPARPMASLRDSERPEEEAKQHRSQWKRREHRRQFMDALAATHGIQKAGDWKRVGRKEVAEAGGGGLLKRYDNSVFALLKDTYPEDEEMADASLVRAKVPQGYWHTWQRRRETMERVAREMGVTDVRQWKKVTAEEVSAAGAGGMLRWYGDSVAKAVIDLFPEMQEGNEVFERKQRESGHWDCRERRKEFVGKVAEEMGVRRVADWKKVTARDFIERGGAGLLARYEYSLFILLQDLLSDGQETPAVFHLRRQTPRNFFQSEDNVRQFMLHLKDALHIRSDDDWFRVSSEELRLHLGRELAKHTDLPAALALAFPDTNWSSVRDRAPASPMKKSAQRQLRLQVQNLFV